MDRYWTPTPMPLPSRKTQFSFATSNPRKPALTRSLVDDEYHLVRRFWEGTGSGDKLVLRSASQSNIISSQSFSELENSRQVCVCGNRLAVCHSCFNYRRGPNARRGGTLGYRPPEVIYNATSQTTAVDIWAVGVIFCSFLTGHYPFITVENDFEALHTFVHLLSLERMQNGAQALGKNLYVKPKPPPLEGQRHYMFLKNRYDRFARASIKLSTNVDNFLSLTSQRLEKIRREMKEPTPPPPTFCPDAPPPKSNVALPRNYKFDVLAYDLCSRLLEPNPRRRISASKALSHPYLCGS